MAKVPQIQRHDNLASWLEREHTQAFIEDQRRYPASVMADPDFASLCAAWERHMLTDAGAQPASTYYADPETGRVLLGKRVIADAQRQADDVHGLAWLACHR